jgi:hypothetical protein
VLAYEPPERVVFSWNISPCWQVEPDPRPVGHERLSSGENLRVVAASRG